MRAFVDFFGVTFRAGTKNPESIRAWVEHLARLWFGDDLEITETGRGWSGYAVRLDLEGVGLAAYCGNSNTVHFEITGSGCAQVKDWQEVVDVIEGEGGKLTRVDVAADDMTGQRYNIAWAQDQYHSGGFKPPRGMHPNAHLWSDEGSGKGCTYYVGSRESGKLFRGYEKGKQLGDPESPWFRVEVEYRAVHRTLPVQMLLDPGAYLAGAYPCLSDIADDQRRPLTVAYESAAKIERAVEHARKQAGRVLHMLIALYGGDIGAAMARLHIPEMPRRLVGVARTLLTIRDCENTYTSCRPPDFLRDATPAEAIALARAHIKETYDWRVRFMPPGNTATAHFLEHQPC